jgi:hypothetical protein
MHFRFRSKPSKMRGNGAASTDPVRIVSWRFFCACIRDEKISAETTGGTV